MTAYSYQVTPRSADIGGFRLRLLEDGEEVGGGVFGASDDDYSDALQEGDDWLATRRD